MSILRRSSGSALALIGGGCSAPFIDPGGPISRAELHLIGLASALMLVVVVPVFVLMIWFIWRFRASDSHGKFRPGFTRSRWIDAAMWCIPSILILILGVISWQAAHRLDPYRDPQSSLKPVNIQVVALRWKWLFIYPDEKIASVNYLVVPVGRPITFQITSNDVMNSFFVPALGSQIYAMAGMRTRLHLSADRRGRFRGLSANYSGAGFASMDFAVDSVAPEQFGAWVANTRARGSRFDKAAMESLELPRINPPQRFASVPPGLFETFLVQGSTAR